MLSAQRRTTILAILLTATAASWPAAAFQVGQSPDFAACNIWFNDQGAPLRTKQGREIGQEVPCRGATGRQDAYSVTLGAAKNTLVIRDETHGLECVLVLAPGSTTIVVPTGCKPLGG